MMLRLYLTMLVMILVFNRGVVLVSLSLVLVFPRVRIRFFGLISGSAYFVSCFSGVMVWVAIIRHWLLTL